MQNTNTFTDYLQAYNFLHYMPGTQEQASKYIDDMYNVAKQLENSGGSENHEKAMEALSYGLHTLQDYYAHFLNDYDWIEHLKGELGLQINYDNPSENRSNEVQALLSTKDYLSRFIKEIEKNKCQK